MGPALRLLLDTHALLWWFSTSPSMSDEARIAIASPENSIFVSAASAFEIGTKCGLGKLPEGQALFDDFDGLTRGQNFLALPITTSDGIQSGRLPQIHRDPFDRMLIAQALNGDLTLISNEKLFDAYGVKRLW